MGFGVEIGLRDLAEDLSPQLGGALDVNGFSIVSLANGNIVIEPDGDGYVYLDGDLSVTGTITINRSVFSDTRWDVTGSQLMMMSHIGGDNNYGMSWDFESGGNEISWGLFGGATEVIFAGDFKISGGGLNVNGLILINKFIPQITSGTGTISFDDDHLTTTGTITGEHIIVSSPTPILVLKDNTYVGDAALGFIEWRDFNNTRLGFFGNSSSGADDLLWKNESSGGHIGMQTTGAGNFTFITGLAGFQVSGTYHERLNVGGNLGFDTVAEITEAQKDAIVLTEDTGGTIGAGEYFYDIVFVTEEGSSKSIDSLFGHGSVPNVVVAANAKVILTGLPISADPRVTSRTIYRGGPGGVAYIAKPIYTIDDNSTTTWTDDGSLTPSGRYNYFKPNTTAGAITIADTLYFRVDEFNVGIGFQALQNATAYKNCAVGPNAGEDLTTGAENTLFGMEAGKDLTTGGVNTLIGKSAGKNLTGGSSNTYVGVSSHPAPGASGTDYNVFVGKEAGLYGPQDSNDDRNTGLGAQAGYWCGGAYNVFVGYAAAKTPDLVQDNNCNVIVGALSGRNITGGASYNIIIGYDIDLDAADGDYQLNIGGVYKGNSYTGAAEIPGTLTARILPRIGTVASSATPTPDADAHDQYNVTALAEAATFGAPTGTPVDGQTLKIRIKDDGTGRAVAWNAIYRAIGTTLPTSTTAGKLIYIGLIYNSIDTKWDCVAVSTET